MIMLRGNKGTTDVQILLRFFLHKIISKTLSLFNLVYRKLFDITNSFNLKLTLLWEWNRPLPSSPPRVHRSSPAAPSSAPPPGGLGTSWEGLGRHRTGEPSPSWFPWMPPLLGSTGWCRALHYTYPHSLPQQTESQILLGSASSCCHMVKQASTCVPASQDINWVWSVTSCYLVLWVPSYGISETDICEMIHGQLISAEVSAGSYGCLHILYKVYGPCPTLSPWEE